MTAGCTFTMLAGPGDAGFLPEILRHLLKTCAVNFHEVLLIADDLPKASHAPGTLENFQAALAQLQSDGLISRPVFLTAIDRNRAALSRKYFGQTVPSPRDHRGIPLFGWIAGLEEAKTAHVLHFDSDILLHQLPGHNWTQAGMYLMEQDPSALFVAPLPGPPAGALLGQASVPALDAQGNFRFKTFSSRRFLVHKERLAKLLPTPVVYTSPKRQFLMRFGIGNAMLPWEAFVDSKLQKSEFYRVHLADPRAWVLHCADHGPQWRKALPAIVRRVEEGWFPPAQAGHYDLKLEAWNAQ